MGQGRKVYFHEHCLLVQNRIKAITRSLALHSTFPKSRSHSLTQTLSKQTTSLSSTEAKNTAPFLASSSSYSCMAQATTFPTYPCRIRWTKKEPSSNRWNAGLFVDNKDVVGTLFSLCLLHIQRIIKTENSSHIFIEDFTFSIGLNLTLF